MRSSTLNPILLLLCTTRYPSSSSLLLLRSPNSCSSIRSLSSSSFQLQYNNKYHCCTRSNNNIRISYPTNSNSLPLTRTTSRTEISRRTTARTIMSSSSGFYTERILENNDQQRPRIIISPTNEINQNALIIILHGLGDTAEGWVDVAEQWIRAMPYCKFILPTAPIQSVTMNMGMKMTSWYDIVGLDERNNEHCNGIEDSVQIVKDIMEYEHQTTNLPYSRMILCGFSQGAALSMFTGYQLSYHLDNNTNSIEQQEGDESSSLNKIAGIVAMSGYLPAIKKFHVQDGLQDIPLLQCHGTQDPLVPYTMAQKSKTILKEQYNIKNIQLIDYPIGHTVNAKEVSDVLKFIQNILPNDEKYQNTNIVDPTSMSLKQLKEYIKRYGLLSKTKGFLEKYEYIKLIQDYRSGNL